MSLHYAVSRHSVGSHCIPGEVTPPLGINDRGLILPGESLIPHPSPLTVTYEVTFSPT